MSYRTADLKSHDLSQRLKEWQDHYNQYRILGSLNGRTPWEAWGERLSVTPFSYEVEAAYNLAGERIRHQHYQTD
jgi:hypothetical protein